MKRKVPVEISIKHVKCIELESGWALPPSPLIQQVTIWVRSTWCKKNFFLSVKFGKSHMLIQKRANPHKEKSSSWMWSKSKCVWFYMIRMQCRVRVKDVWGHCMHMFPYNYLHFDQNENCNFSRVRLKMINGLVDHSNDSSEKIAHAHAHASVKGS